MVLAKRNKKGQIILNKKVAKLRQQYHEHLIEIDFKNNAEKIICYFTNKIEFYFKNCEVPQYKQYEKLPRVGTLFGTYSQFMIEILDVRLYQYKGLKKEISKIKRKINEKRMKLVNSLVEGTDDDYYYENIFKILVLRIEDSTKSKLKELSKLYKQYNIDMKPILELRKIYYEKSLTDNQLLTPSEFEENIKNKSVEEIVKNENTKN